MFRVIGKYGKGTVIKIAAVFVPVYHVICGNAFCRWIFQTLIQSPFSETAISEIHRLWGSSFVWKCLKFNVDFRNEEKNWEKDCFLWGNNSWIGPFKLPLFRREYLSSAVNALTNSLKIFHRTNVDFLQLNYVQSDQ